MRKGIEIAIVGAVLGATVGLIHNHAQQAERADLRVATGQQVEQWIKRYETAKSEIDTQRAMRDFKLAEDNGTWAGLERPAARVWTHLKFGAAAARARSGSGDQDADRAEHKRALARLRTENDARNGAPNQGIDAGEWIASAFLLALTGAMVSLILAAVICAADNCRAAEHG